MGKKNAGALTRRGHVSARICVRVYVSRIPAHVSRGYARSVLYIFLLIHTKRTPVYVRASYAHSTAFAVRLVAHMSNPAIVIDEAHFANTPTLLLPLPSRPPLSTPSATMTTTTTHAHKRTAPPHRTLTPSPARTPETLPASRWSSSCRTCKMCRQFSPQPRR